MIRNLGSKLKIKIAPHDLRRYSATYASLVWLTLSVS